MNGPKERSDMTEKETEQTAGQAEEKPGAKEAGPTMLPIWFWIGTILLVYGLIVAGFGIYYVFHPQTRTVLARINPSLWWGGIMLAVGLLFFLPNLRRLRRFKD
jgi:uncharacterized BrkB/YihY/UPF0761 family membrane protein